MIGSVPPCCLCASVRCTLGWKHEGDTICKRKKRGKKIETYFCWTSLSLSLSSEVWREIKGEQSDGPWRWRLAPPRRWRTESLRAPSSSSSSPLSPPIAYFQPNLGFVHLVLWSRLQTSCPNFTCHSRLLLLWPQMCLPSTSSGPVSLLLSASLATGVRVTSYANLWCQSDCRMRADIFAAITASQQAEH